MKHVRGGADIKDVKHCQRGGADIKDVKHCQRGGADIKDVKHVRGGADIKDVKHCQRGGAGIKDVKHCQRGGSAKMTYGDSMVSPACEFRGLGSVSESACKMNSSWPGGRLSMILLHTLFPSSMRTPLGTNNFLRLEFHFSSLCC